jgi:hypothetical protein
MTIDFTPTFIEEKVPPISRVSRDSYPWEEYLAPTDEETGARSGIIDRPGVALRVYTFIEKSEARSRASTIQKRWTKMLPLEEIKTATRELDDGTFGVYVTWLGEITQERRDELTAASERRRDLILAARSREPAVVAAPAAKPAAAASGAKTTAQRLREAQAAK